MDRVLLSFYCILTIAHRGVCDLFTITGARRNRASGRVNPGRNRVLEKYAPLTKELALAAMQKMQHSPPA
jgi:hypothetical protein